MLLLLSRFGIKYIYINITNNFNLLFRQICIRYPGLSWESQIPPEEHHQWKMALRQLLEIRNISVPRFVLEGITDYDDVTAVLFCDGSDVASAAKIYVRFPVAGGKYVARYLTGATKIAAKGNNNAPRQECTAMLLCCRLFDQVCTTWSDVKFKEVILCSDSNCALGGVLGRTQAQILFFSTRNYESKFLIDKHKIQVKKIPSRFQLADKATKLSLDYNAALDSEWWECEWLSGPVSSWRISDYSYSRTDEAVLMKAVYKPKSCAPQIQSNNTAAQTVSQPSSEFLFQLIQNISWLIWNLSSDFGRYSTLFLLDLLLLDTYSLVKIEQIEYRIIICKLETIRIVFAYLKLFE